jgi:hypothetical protein
MDSAGPATVSGASLHLTDAYREVSRAVRPPLPEEDRVFPRRGPVAARTWPAWRWPRAPARCSWRHGTGLRFAAGVPQSITASALGAMRKVPDRRSASRLTRDLLDHMFAFRRPRQDPDLRTRLRSPPLCTALPVGADAVLRPGIAATRPILH